MTGAEQRAQGALVLHSEAMTGLLEELAERVYLLRDELWQLRAQPAQQGGMLEVVAKTDNLDGFCR